MNQKAVIALLALAFVTLCADTIGVASFGLGRTTHFEVVRVSEDVSFIREHKKGLVIRTSRDLPTVYRKYATEPVDVALARLEADLH